MQRLGDWPRGEVLLHGQRLLEQGRVKAQRVSSLRNTELAEILARRAVFLHVVGGEESEAGVRPAGAIRINRVARELAEVREREAKGIDVVRIAGDAGYDVRVARLHRARRAAQRHYTARTTQRDMVEPARRQPQMLRETDGGVGSERKARDGEPVDLVLLQA
jgi:hypothetical protein